MNRMLDNYMKIKGAMFGFHSSLSVVHQFVVKITYQIPQNGNET